MLWVLVPRTLNEPDGLSNSTSAVGWHVYCAWYFTMCFVKFESAVVTFDSGIVALEINVWYCFWKCEKLLFVPLQKFSATSQTYHWGALTQLPVTHLLHNASWQVPGQVALSGNHSVNCKHWQNIRDFALWYSRFSVECLLAAPMVVGAAFLMLKCISSYLDCQYDSLSIDKCSKIGHRGPRCEQMLTNEEFIMKKNISVSAMIITFTPSLL